jgi:hypothetical protein
MQLAHAAVAAASLAALAACAQDGSAADSGRPGLSGLTGTVALGPTCPVAVEGMDCDDKVAAHAKVTVSEQSAGEAYAAGDVVATGTTDARGVYRISVRPGAYVVTAQAGMSCELMDARVTAGLYSVVDIPCDTGIR